MTPSSPVAPPPSLLRPPPPPYAPPSPLPPQPLRLPLRRGHQLRRHPSSLAAAVHGAAAAKNFAHAIRLTKSLVQASSSSPGRSPTSTAPTAAGAAFAALASTSTSPAPAPGVLVIALCQMRLLDEALSVFRRLRTLPELPACNAILDGLVKAHRFGCAWQLLDEMLSRGMEPSVGTYNTLINACRQQGDVTKAQDVWDQMVARRIDPNVVTYTTMICALCEEGCIGDAEQVYGAMKEAEA
ncbi:unnamed protein product [Urochloa humidicola]